MKVNRTKGPPITSIRSIELPQYQIIHLDNGIPVYYMNQGTQELLKLDLVFEGARHSETHRTQSRAHSSLMKEGSTKESSESYSHFFDFYGASYNTKSSLDYTTVTLFCLSRHFDPLCKKLGELVFEAAFPEDEIQKFINTNQQKLQMSLSKNEVIAYRELSASIFGKDHIYGYNSELADFALNTQENLKAYHQAMLEERDAKIFLTGAFPEEEVLACINQVFGKMPFGKRKSIPYSNQYELQTGEQHFTSKNKHQIALRMGRRFGSRLHPDYSRMSFLTNLFGGFFGSRLMKNIREDKGYTYNIYSDIDMMLFDGYFYISTEMDAEYLEPAKIEIIKEMEKLKNEMIPEDEIEMNKNYILGNFLNATDGPFQAMRLVKSVILSGRQMSDLDQDIEQMAEMEGDTLQELAQEFFDLDEFTTIIVGL